MMLPASLIAFFAVGQTSLPPLHTKGEMIVDSSGKVVSLRGVNLGGWLVEEIWLSPWINKERADAPEVIRDHSSLWRQLSKSVGPTAMLRIRDAWRDNWIQASDFVTIKRMGFNHVRLPFLDRLLNEPNGMERLRWAVREAAKNGLYVVLDLHGAPGGQSTEHHTGEEKRNRLWFDVENITRLEDIWTKLGREFGNNNTVAAFDLMNEPTGTPNTAMLHLVYDRVIRAVRKVAPTKVVLVDDGYRGFETTPHPNLANWTNVAFSLHFYNFDAKKTDDHVSSLRSRLPKLKELQGGRQAPIYAGEFNLEPFNSATSMSEFVGEFNKAGWSWALWTYKVAPATGSLDDWGLFRPATVEPLNPFTDSESELLRKIKRLRTEHMTAPQPLINSLTKSN